MGAAIDALLSENAGWVDVAADAKNAFNSFCRSQMWGPLIENFPDLAALGLAALGPSSPTMGTWAAHHVQRPIECRTAA